MSEMPPRSGLDNAAWITISTKLSADSLLEFCSDVERLYRLNPFLRIFSWQTLGKNKIQADWENQSMAMDSRTTTQFEMAYTNNEIQLKYLSGIKLATYLIIDATHNGSQLTIIDDYGDSKKNTDVDKSLTAWGRSLKRFFDHYAYLHHIPFAKTIIDRYWIQFSPFTRRISYILVALTVIELIALLLFVLLLRLL